MREEMKQLLQTAARGPIPLVRFELRSTKEKALRSTALPHVWMTDERDSMELVKARGACIAQAEAEGWLRLDYALPVTLSRDYAVYVYSSLYASFCHMVEEGAKRPGFLFDTPYLKRGVAILMPKGRQALQKGSGQA